MRFYQESRRTRTLLTVVCSLTAVLGAFQLLERHWFQGAVFLFLGCVQTWSLWNRYWEMRDDGTLHSKGYGAEISYPLSGLRYAGPLRGKVSFPASWKKDVELEFANIRTVRRARVDKRAVFLESLHQAAPQANVVPLWLVDETSGTSEQRSSRKNLD